MTELRNLTCKTNPISRNRGGNAVAAAAYRSGLDLLDQASGKLHRFAGRSADVEGSLILTPDGAPDWLTRRADLWNSAEAQEKRKDSRTGRDVILGLAWELTPEQRQAAVLEFAQQEFVRRGYVVDVAFHKYGSMVRDHDRIYDSKSGEYVSGAEKIASWKEAGLPFLEAHQVQGVDMPHVKIERLRGGEIAGMKLFQPHAHCLVSHRKWLTDENRWADKVDPLFAKPQTAMNWRYEWPRTLNRHLEHAGWDLRISCTARDSDEALPLKSESLPMQEYHIERRGQDTTAKMETDFNRIQNEAIRAGQAERETTETGDINTTERSEAARSSGWWRNMREHFSELREGWRGQMRSTWDALKERWRGQSLEPGNPPKQGHERE